MIELIFLTVQPKKIVMRDTTQNLNNQQSIPIHSIEIDTIMKLSIQNNHPYVINAGRLPRLTKIKQLMKAYKDKDIIIPPILVYEQELYTMPSLRKRGVKCVKYKIKDGRHRVVACINLNRDIIDATIINTRN